MLRCWFFRFLFHSLNFGTHFSVLCLLRDEIYSCTPPNYIFAYPQAFYPPRNSSLLFFPTCNEPVDFLPLLHSSRSTGTNENELRLEYIRESLFYRGIFEVLNFFYTSLQSDVNHSPLQSGNLHVLEVSGLDERQLSFGTILDSPPIFLTQIMSRTCSPEPQLTVHCEQKKKMDNSKISD